MDVTSTPVCPSTDIEPASESIVIFPTDVFIFVAPSTSIDKVEVPSIVIASLASISNVVESISIGLSAVVPILIDVAESIFNAPLASISKVDESISIATSDSTPISIPPLPSIVTLPPSASISIAPAAVSYTHLTLPTILLV